MNKKIKNTQAKEIFKYKNQNLTNHITDTLYKIIPKRITGTNSLIQRYLTKEIKKARYLALLPYTNHKKKINN